MIENADVFDFSISQEDMDEMVCVSIRYGMFVLMT